jgi:hypothetical protein
MCLDVIWGVTRFGEIIININRHLNLDDIELHQFLLVRVKLCWINVTLKSLTIMEITTYFTCSSSRQFASLQFQQLTQAFLSSNTIFLFSFSECCPNPFQVGTFKSTRQRPNKDPSFAIECRLAASFYLLDGVKLCLLMRHVFLSIPSILILRCFFHFRHYSSVCWHFRSYFITWKNMFEMKNSQLGNDWKSIDF